MEVKYMRMPNYCEAKNRQKVDIKYLDCNIKYEKCYENKKYFIRTYGCQMNVHDSEQIAFYLEKLGFIETDTLENADIVVLNDDYSVKQTYCLGVAQL